MPNRAQRASTQPPPTENLKPTCRDIFEGLELRKEFVVINKDSQHGQYVAVVNSALPDASKLTTVFSQAPQMVKALTEIWDSVQITDSGLRDRVHNILEAIADGIQYEVEHAQLPIAPVLPRDAYQHAIFAGESMLVGTQPPGRVRMSNAVNWDAWDVAVEYQREGERLHAESESAQARQREEQLAAESAAVDNIDIWIPRDDGDDFPF